MRTASTIGVLVLVLGTGQLLLQALLLLMVGLRSAATGEATSAASRVVSGEPLALGVAQLVGLGAVLVLARRVVLPDWSPREAFGLRPGVVPRRTLGLSFLAGLALQLPLTELMNLVVDVVPALTRDPARDAAIRALVRVDGPIRALSVPFAAVVVPALTEELLFRGVVLGRLRELVSPPAAVALTAVLFGAFHLEPLAFVYATLAGLVLGGLTVRAPNVLPAIALHAGFNTLPLALSIDVCAIPGFNTPEDAHISPWLALSSAALCAVALVLAARTMAPANAT